MNFDEYQKAANRTLMGKEQVLTNCVLGLTGKSGDVSEMVRKYTFQSQNLDKDELTQKMGDVLWYLSQIAEWSDISFDDVAAENIKRLKTIYPNGKDQINQINM